MCMTPSCPTNLEEFDHLPTWVSARLWYPIYLSVLLSRPPHIVHSMTKVDSSQTLFLFHANVISLPLLMSPSHRSEPKAKIFPSYTLWKLHFPQPFPGILPHTTLREIKASRLQNIKDSPFKMVFIVLLISNHTLIEENLEIQKSTSLYLKIISFMFILLPCHLNIPSYLIFCCTFRPSFIQTIQANVASDFLIIINNDRLHIPGNISRSTKNLFLDSLQRNPLV